MDETQHEGSFYTRRPLWQWILLYVVIGALAYFLLYYFIFTQKPSIPTRSVQKATISPTEKFIPASNIYQIKSDTQQGQYITDFAGMTLYVFDKDTAGISNCSGTCLKNWPPYTSGATVEKNLPINITVINRPDGSKQFAWKGMPLYYYAADTKSG